MLAYAPRPDRQRLSPTALTLIIAGHIAAIGAVMSAKTEVFHNPFTVTKVTLIKDTPVPPPEPQKHVEPRPSQSQLTTVPPLNPLPHSGLVTGPLPQPLPPLGTEIGSGTAHTIPLEPPIVRTGPRLATAPEALRPPYPASKRESGDEASLRLKLTIDATGRVVAVDPVGRVDPTFFEVARRHILRAWHYQPAMEGSKAVPSVTTITLRFELGKA